MTADQLRKEIKRRCSHVIFSYQGKDCGIDPLSWTEVTIWCGEESIQLDSLDAAMQTPIFDGQSLEEIVETLTDIE